VKQASEDPPIAVYNLDGEIYATSNICSHDHSLLSEGYIDGDRIECSWHFAQFCIRTGAAVTPPAVESILTYVVSIDDNDIYVEVPDA
jgi:nitrite reductase/ring-hydroxylating ferredoxin subunit